VASDLILSRHPGESASDWAARLRATDTADWSAHQRAMLAHAVAFAEDLAQAGGDALLETVDPPAAATLVTAAARPPEPTALEQVLRLLLRLSPAELRRVARWIEDRQAAPRP
jgi:hypothetical protein